LELNDFPEMETGASLPAITENGNALQCAYICSNSDFPGWDRGEETDHPGFDEYCAVIEFTGVASFKFGAPNDEGRPKALYEPVHGSAPDITGKGLANPIACILSFAMALRYSFDQGDEATRLEKAVEKVLADGARTADLMGEEGGTPISTTEMGDVILKALDASL
jgi:hypothetical protein